MNDKEIADLWFDRLAKARRQFNWCGLWLSIYNDHHTRMDHRDAVEAADRIAQVTLEDVL